MEKCAQERKVWLEAQAEVERLRKELNAETGLMFSTRNTPETLDKAEKAEADFAAAEERLKTTQKAYDDCMARSE